MSYMVQAKTTIIHPNLALLGEALQIIAGAHEGGRVADHILDYGMRQRRVNTQLALFTEQVRRGVGIELTAEGAIGFKGDPWLAETGFEQLQQEILQTYVSLAAQRALEQMGYTSEATQIEQYVVIRGVTYPKEIQIEINPDGTTKTNFSGFKGSSCLDTAARLRDLLAQFGIQSEQTSKPELKNAQAEASG